MNAYAVLCCSVAVANAQPWTQVGEDILGTDEHDFPGRSVAMSGDGTAIAITAQQTGAFPVKVWIHTLQTASPPLNRVHFELFNESGCSAPGFKTAVIGPAPKTDTASCEAANGYCQECE